jgi:hypothetical protein
MLLREFRDDAEGKAKLPLAGGRNQGDDRELFLHKPNKVGVLLCHLEPRCSE